jgi:CYTH domain-containing protein
VYVPEDPGVHPRLRLRQEGDRYEVTKKLPAVHGDASQHHEQTIQLDRAEFEELATGRRRVEKDRYEVVIDGRLAEVDVFRGALTGLAVIDFEFDALEELESFDPPACCGPDVTHEDFIAGGLLAGRSYGDIEEDLARFSYTPVR